MSPAGTGFAADQRADDQGNSSAAEQIAWIDLLDPDEGALRQAWPRELHASALEKLLAPPARHLDDPRPRFESHGSYVFGIFLVPVILPDTKEVRYQEVDVVLTHSVLLLVRKTPPSGTPFNATRVQARREGELSSAGMYAFHLIDEIAERYLHLVDDLNAEIDELEEGVEKLPASEIRSRLSGLRHDILYLRRTLTPTRDAVQGVANDRIDTDGEEIFPRPVEVHFADVHEKLLRACEGLELSRDLVAGVRDYHQGHLANEQNEIMKRLTVIASVLLLPTLIAGIYGQNLHGSFPGENSSFGYEWSLGLIIVVTVIQLAAFKKMGWIGAKKA
jgi:magnesium transporter